MRPVKVSLTSATSSAPIPVNWRAACFEVSIGLVFSGTASFTYSVQHTFDDIQDSTITPVWHEHEFLTNQVITADGNDDGNYDKPVRAIRLNISAYTSGVCEMSVIQSN